MDYKNIKKIHFVGIKGVGMAPLAVIAKEAGFDVTGCDVADEFITDKPLKKAGIYPLTDFNNDHVKSVDLVITTGAHGGFNNPEVQFAQKQYIPILMQGKAVGEFMKGELFGRALKGISIAGCHGKTTTTAMIATIFQKAGFDPSYVIGTGDIISLGGSGHYGKGDFFIAEADEYVMDPIYDTTTKFLAQFPKYLIITNIEFDHPDIYKNIEQIQDTYLQFTNNIQKNGALIANGDDIYSRKIIEKYGDRKILFGFNSSNEFIIKDVVLRNGKTLFKLENLNKHFAEKFELKVIGNHNVFNATAAIIVSLQAGITVTDIKKGLQTFTGTKRRLEYIGCLQSGAELYDDYAHHPTEIKATLHALRQLHPNKKIIAIFQPHTYSRTKLLFEDFSSSFSDTDQVIITSIYASQREQYDPTVSSTQLVQAIKTKKNEAIFVPDIGDVVKYLREKQFDSNYCIVTMGAGDIYKVYEQLKF